MSQRTHPSLRTSHQGTSRLSWLDERLLSRTPPTIQRTVHTLIYFIFSILEMLVVALVIFTHASFFIKM